VQNTSEQTSANDRASWRAEQEELKDIGIAGVYQTFFNPRNRLKEIGSGHQLAVKQLFRPLKVLCIKALYNQV
jgi:hypothetical protein